MFALVLPQLSAQSLPSPLVPDETTIGSLCTPSHADFAEYRYSENIPYCRRNVATSLKQQIYEEYQIPKECRGEYTIDHFYPLSLGGDNQRENLWPEHKAIKESRMNLETRLYRDISKAAVSQAEALQIIKEKKLNPNIDQIPQGSYCSNKLIQDLISKHFR